MKALIESTKELSRQLAPMKFGAPAVWTYRPLEYAWKSHEAYLKRFGKGPKRVLFLGMNPGPYGMVQTGIPFGEIPAVRDWMGINEPVGKPEKEHPKRPVDGFDCKRSEVSGRRLWGLFAERFGSAEDFFADHFVLNFCPLVWMSETGANITPDKLTAKDMKPVEKICMQHLKEVIEIMKPEYLIGVGAFAEQRLKQVAEEMGCEAFVGRVLHPSPASPAANRGWAEAATQQMVEMGIWKPA